jgi:hypothetical protein
MISTSARPNDAELISQMPNFVLLAQIRIGRRLNIFGTQKILSGVLPNNQNTIQLPNYYIRSISLTFFDPSHDNQVHVMTYRMLEYLMRLQNSSHTRSIPMDYAEVDVNTLMVAPFPPDLSPLPGLSFQLIFHEIYQPLSPTNQTNYLSERLMDLLLDACLYEMYIWLKDSYYIEKYESNVEKGIQNVLAQDELNRTDRGSNADVN